MDVGHTEAECREEAAVREAVEAGELLGQHGEVPAGQHQHGEPELHAGRAPRRIREAHDRVGTLAAQPLAQPQRVEAELFQRVDEGVERLVVVGEAASTEAETDTNLHGPEATAFLMGRARRTRVGVAAVTYARRPWPIPSTSSPRSVSTTRSAW